MKAPALLKRFVRRGSNRGIAVIYIALLLIALLAFVGLAVDIGYMYVAKTQLQNAADAAALAGAAKLTGGIDSSTSAFYEGEARQEAWKFACKNKAAKQAVYVQTNSSVDCNAPPSATELNAASNIDTGDIIVGNWNETSSVFTRATGSTGLSINAMLVKARRTDDSPGGKVSIFFGRVINHPTMAASASAIATLTTPPFLALPICLPNCNLRTPVDGQWDYDNTEDRDRTNLSPVLCTDKNSSNSSPPGLRFYLNPSSTIEDPTIPGTAWTAFQVAECPNVCGGSSPTPNEMADIVTGKTKIPRLCQKRICNAPGNYATVINKELTDQFEANAKEYTFQNDTKTKSFKVTGWQVFLVILDNKKCDGTTFTQSCPGDPSDGKSYLIKRYTKVLMTEIVSSGHQGYRLIALPRDAKPENPITITEYEQIVCCKKGSGCENKTVKRWTTTFDCVPCEEADELFGGGTVSKLVK
jgi:Flp pilus assembly protein TadG